MLRSAGVRALAGGIVLFSAAFAARADLFELPDRPPSAETNQPPRDRQRPVQATLAEHAIYWALTDLGVGPQQRLEVSAKMSQIPAVQALSPQKAFLVGVRVACRVESELEKARLSATLAARSVLGEAADYRSSLPLPAGAPLNAARFEQAVTAARSAIVTQHLRLQYARWLEEALAEVEKKPD